MENHRAKLLRDLGSRTRIPEGHKDGIERYEQAGIIARWIMRKREPAAFQHYQRELERREHLRAQQSRVDARCHPDPDPSEIIVF